MNEAVGGVMPPLSEAWKVFLHVDDADDYSSVPDLMHGRDGGTVSPKSARLADGSIDLESLSNSFKANDTAIAWNEFDCDESGRFKLGVSADWWMEIFLNGNPIYSTMEKGNGLPPCLPTDHVVVLDVRRGKNILAVKIQAGMSGWLFCCGDPDPSSYAALCSMRLAAYRETWAALREKLDRNIERNRKGDAILEIIDKDGNALDGAKVDIQQKSHDFAFGCNTLALGYLGRNNDRYEQEFARLFNLATTTFCWSAMEPTPGELRFKEGSRDIWRRPPPDRVVAFGKKHGIRLKGQPLMADQWYPDWASRDAQELKLQYQAYFKQVADRYAHDFEIWDVVNEALINEAGRNPDFPLFKPDPLIGVDWAFREAAKLFPKEATLEINEALRVNCPIGRNRYYDFVKSLIEQGTPIRSIGFQYHLFDLHIFLSHLIGLPSNEKTVAIEKMIDVYERFSDFGLPLFITEVTIPSGLESFANQGSSGEALQAEVLGNLYRLWFSISGMAGITYWNLPDGSAWQDAWRDENTCKGGLLDEQLREKPAYQTLYQLIHREWNTHLKAETDSRGCVGFRGFYGTYTVDVSWHGESRTYDLALSRNSTNTVRLQIG